jgi:hypothetical protein
MLTSRLLLMMLLLVATEAQVCVVVCIVDSVLCIVACVLVCSNGMCYERVALVVKTRGLVMAHL